jgi:hypothetical protein
MYDLSWCSKLVDTEIKLITSQLAVNIYMYRLCYTNGDVYFKKSNLTDCSFRQPLLRSTQTMGHTGDEVWRKQDGWLLQRLASYLNRDRTDARVWGLNPPHPGHMFLKCFLFKFHRYRSTSLRTGQGSSKKRCPSARHAATRVCGGTTPLILIFVVPKTHTHTQS